MGQKEFYTFTLLLSLTFAVIVSIPFCSAIDVHEYQSNMVLTLERGSTHQFLLIMEDIDEDAVITSSGDASDWVSFGEDEEGEYNIYPFFFVSVPVTISIPEDTELGEYSGSILANDIRVSNLNIKVTLELSDAKAFQKIKNVDDEVGSMKDQVESLTQSLVTMRSQIVNLEDEVSGKMDEIYKYQKNLTALESTNTDVEAENSRLKKEMKDLNEKSQNLEESNEELNSITGMMSSVQIPGMFFGGIILGILIMVTVIKRSVIKKRLKKKLGMEDRMEGQSKEKQFKYSYSRNK